MVLAGRRHVATGAGCRGVGNSTDAAELAAATGATPDLSLVRTYTSKMGVSGNLEQQILPGVGLFARAGCTPGNLETHAFTDDQATLAGGASVSGKFWGRPNDVWPLTFDYQFIANPAYNRYRWSRHGCTRNSDIRFRSTNIVDVYRRATANKPSIRNEYPTPTM
jgi:hypothetical protein